MKKRMTLLVVALALVSFAGKNMKAYVGFDRDTDFSTIKTFTYYEPRKDSVADHAPQVHEMIKYLLIIHFKDGGLKQVKENPDIYVTYHTTSSQGARMNTTMYQYHYSAGWWWSPLWGSGMDVSQFTSSTLIVGADLARRRDGGGPGRSKRQEGAKGDRTGAQRDQQGVAEATPVERWKVKRLNV